jgi:hypothetical protein
VSRTLRSFPLYALDARVALDFFVRDVRPPGLSTGPPAIACCNLSRPESFILAMRSELRMAFAFPVRSLAFAAAMRAEDLVAMSRVAK